MTMETMYFVKQPGPDGSMTLLYQGGNKELAHQKVKSLEAGLLTRYTPKPEGRIKIVFANFYKGNSNESEGWTLPKDNPIATLTERVNRGNCVKERERLTQFTQPELDYLASLR